ncbi:MAG: DUF6880 family protein [Hyphomicrobiales bacterium]
MAAKTTLNAKNLKSLGAARLAELMMELTEGDAVAKRKLRLKLAAKLDPSALGREVKKRLSALAKARSFVDWRKIKDLGNDLDMQRSAIVDQVAKVDPQDAYELMWCFLALAAPTYERADDSNGYIGEIFAGACDDLGSLASTAKPDVSSLTNRTFEALKNNDYGQYDGLISALTPALGKEGLHLLKMRLEELASAPVEASDDGEDRAVFGWSGQEPTYKDDLQASMRNYAIRAVLTDIDDALGDVDGYIAQFSDEAKKAPRVAADLASRLLAAGRPNDALTLLEAADRDNHYWTTGEWENTYIDTLETLGRKDDAQDLRWESFSQTLNPAWLKDYLQRHQDFDDIAMEERAIDHAMTFPSVHEALIFLVNWPSHEKAACLVLERAQEINGDHYEFLVPAALKLEGKYLLAATILRRALIDFTLKATRSKRYKYAAKHLLECESSASQIDDFRTFGDHTEYVEKLRKDHGRKSSFWALIK